MITLDFRTGDHEENYFPDSDNHHCLCQKKRISNINFVNNKLAPAINSSQNYSLKTTKINFL